MSTSRRRSVTLAWTVLFVLSLLMQAGVLANPQDVFAVHDEGLFELDGNAVNDGGVAGNDWDQVFGGTSNANSTQFITDPVDSNTDQTFTGGSSKDDINTTSWLWKFAKASQAKNDITHAFAAAYTKAADGHTIAYFGLNKFEADGDNFVGFWFFKSTIGPTGPGTPPGSPFSGSGHSVGDILVLADYTNGGALATFNVFKWVGSGGDVNGTLQTVASGVPCTALGDLACGATNGDTEVAPWPYDGRDGDPGEFPPGTLFEGGIDLSALGLDTGCFTTFLAETRSSQSVDATLSDFALGNFSFCVTPTISTQVSGTSFVVGSQGSVFDTAHLSGTKGVPTGTVDFFLCGPSGAAANCTTGGADAGQDKAVNGTGDATSNAMAPTTPGFYCFRAEYTPAQGSHYLPVTHVLSTNECFQVLKASPGITTSAEEDVDAGDPVSDSALLSGGFNPTGTITFTAYGPDDNDCNGTAAYSTSVTVNHGNGTYGPVSFTPSVAGTYHWVASYSGDTNNNGATGACGDNGENDNVNKVNPSISTSGNEEVEIGTAIGDSATLSGGVNPTGTITFTAYGPNDDNCDGTAAYSTSVAVTGNGGYGPVSFIPTAVGAYHWIASYSGDANNNPAAGSCGDLGENDSVIKVSPSIATVLQGGGQSGASITVPLGTDVHDTATLSGATADADGSVHYTVYRDADCESVFFDAGTKAVTNGSVADSNVLNVQNAGSYYWQADYSGDAKNNDASSPCTLEIVTVEPNIPSISTSADENVTVGSEISDSAELTGGFNPTGTITFTAFGPNDDLCAGEAAYSTSVNVDGNGTYGPVSFTPAGAGVYHWIAAYSGDDNNAAVSGGCGDEGENDAVGSPVIHAVKLVGTNQDEPGPTSVAEPGDILNFYITVSNTGNGDATNVDVTDDINPVLAHSSFVGCSDSCSNVAGVLGWTIALLQPGESKLLTFAVQLDDEFPVGVTTLPNVVVVVGPGSNCLEGSDDEDCDTTTTLNQPALTILKDVSGNTGGTAVDGTPIAKIGDTLTFTLSYDISSPPAHNGVIWDPIPAGLEYVASSATTNGEFDEVSYDSATRTLTWLADLVTVDGSVSFKVTVLENAPDLSQPIVNVASIDSDDTDQDNDDAKVLVQEVLDITNPPTSTLDNHEQAPSNPGFSLMLILLALAAFALSLGYVTPVPERARRRTEGRRR